MASDIGYGNVQEKRRFRLKINQKGPPKEVYSSYFPRERVQSFKCVRRMYMAMHDVGIVLAQGIKLNKYVAAK